MAKTKKANLSALEQKLARIIALSKRRLTTTQLAQKAGVSWVTAKNALEKLRFKLPISKQTLGNRTYWFVRK